MKTYFFTLGFLFLLISSANSKVITVDNNANAGADYTSLQEAVNAASADDSIYIHPSPHSYGNVNIARRLTLLGPGHYPQEFSLVNARLGQIVLQNGSSGSTFSGLVLDRIGVQIQHQAHNITIENNLFAQASEAIAGAWANTNADSDNWVIRGNVFKAGTGCGGCTLINLRKSGKDLNENWLIANNIIIIDGGSQNKIFAYTNASTLIINNTIIQKSSGDHAEIFGAQSGYTNLAIVKNNIIIATDFYFTKPAKNCSSCTFDHNLTYNPNATLEDLPGTDNLNNTDPDFKNVPSLGWSYNHDFNVAADSPAHNAGSDDTDLGAYGAGFPFSKYGYPPGMPVIEELKIANQLISEGEDVTITIKARAGQQ